MVRIILAKYQDELRESDVPEFRCSPLDLQYQEGREQVADRVRWLFEEVRDAHLDVFIDHETITAGDREIATVVSELQDFRFLPEDDSDEVYDVVGAAYEVYVGSHLKGDRGQYFTHRLIVQLLVRIIDPGEQDTILDPAVGSGGFLIASMRHIAGKIAASHRAKSAKETLKRGVYNRLFGIDKSPKLVKVARTNMILASDGHSGLIRGDSLEPPTKLPRSFVQKAGPGVPTVILTNPPFGATVEHRVTPEREPEIVSQFDVTRVWRLNADGLLQPTRNFLTEGVPPEYLFVERCLTWVAPGGRVGIVVPRGLLDNDKALPLRTLIFREARVLAVINCHDDTFKPHTDAKAALLVLEKRRPQANLQDEDYPIFMAISQGIGHNGVGEPVYRTDAKGDPILEDGEPVLDEDTDDIYRAWDALTSGEPSPSEWYFMGSRRQITPSLNLNPVRYLPRYAESLQRVLELGEQPGWTVERLGQIADVFGGHRLKRPYADKGVTAGPNIVRFFTGNAVTQTRGENVKYLDLAKAKPPQLKMIEKMYLRRGMILITRSGTVGRVVYATQYHEGAVGTEDVIRVVVADDALRGYVYQFLSSKLGQDQLKANIYGAIVDHIEPDDVKNVQVPIPTDRDLLEQIGRPVIEGMELQEAAYSKLTTSWDLLRRQVEGDDPRLRTYADRLAGDSVIQERLRAAGEHIREDRDYPGALTGPEFSDRVREG
ncbi:MAG: N-6 DNA methylase [Actinomycetota bacterium]